MKIQQSTTFLTGLLAVFFLFSPTSYAESEGLSDLRSEVQAEMEEAPSGNYFYLNPFAYKPATADEHWDHAHSLLEKGRTSAGLKQLEIFMKRWPDSPQAAQAQSEIGDLYLDAGKNKKAFEAYETLVEKYYAGIKDYTTVLEKQTVIAEEEMERKRMRWLFGGYTAPERAVPYFESIIRNAPQWDRAPEMQYLIGEAYRKNDDYEMAVAAYTTVEYRYPESSFAEQAAFAKVESLRELVRATPNSLDVREQAQLAADIFQSIYPQSEHQAEVEAFRQALRDAAALSVYETGAFYERMPKSPRSDSAQIYYRKVVKEYPGTGSAELAEERLRVLLPEEAPAGGEPVRPEIVALPLVAVAVPEEATELPANEVVTEDETSSLDPEAALTDNVQPVALVRPARVSTNNLLPLPERMSTDTNAVEVTADRMEYIGDLLVADGNVTVQQIDASLRAQHMTVNQKTGGIIATGNVIMLNDGQLWQGEKLIYNFKTKEGTFGASSMFFDPIYISAMESDRIAPNVFLMKDALITTCSGEDALITMKAKELRITENPEMEGGTFIQAKKVTVYVGGVPVFYTPVWQRHLGYRVFTFKPGYSGRLGFFLMGRAALRPTDWLNTSTHFDLFSDRGVGLGQDFFWQVKKETEEGIVTNGVGALEAYYINDSDPLNNARTAVEEQLTDSTRYRIKLGHHHKFDDENYFITKVNYLSDPLILKDYFPEEYKTTANPENYAVLQRATDDYAAGLRIDKRLNDFYTTVDRLPELDFDWYRSQIKDSPWYYENDSSVAFLQKLHGDPDATQSGGTNLIQGVGTNMVPVVPPDYDTFRLDTYNRVFRPIRIKDYYNLIPRAAYRGTWYSDTAAGGGELRHILEFGALANVKSYKTLTEKSGFYGEGLRHIFEPYADYSYRFEPSVTPDELYQFDEIDTFDKENTVRFGMRNFLQSKRGESGTRIANFLDADLFTSYRLETQDDEDDFGPLEGDIELSLTDHFNIQSDFEFDWNESEFKDFNARAYLMTEDMSEYGFEYRYSTNRVLYTPYVRLFPNEKWSFDAYAQYDSENGVWQERRLTVRRKFDCVGMGVGFEIDDEDEATIWLQFWLNAFPQSAFGLR